MTTQAQAATQAPAATPPEPQQPAPAAVEAGAQAQAATPAQPAPGAARDSRSRADPGRRRRDPGRTRRPRRPRATAADVHAGVQVRDQTGGMVGTIESVDATGAVVATGTARAKLPLTSFGRNSQGLVISLTRAQLEAAAQQAAADPGRQLIAPRSFPTPRRFSPHRRGFLL